jgi:hypothetical protein
MINPKAGAESLSKFINKLTALIGDPGNRNPVIPNISLTNNFSGFFSIKAFERGRLEMCYYEG